MGAVAWTAGAAAADCAPGTSALAWRQGSEGEGAVKVGASDVLTSWVCVVIGGEVAVVAAAVAAAVVAAAAILAFSTINLSMKSFISSIFFSIAYMRFASPPPLCASAGVRKSNCSTDGELRASESKPCGYAVWRGGVTAATAAAAKLRGDKDVMA